MTECSRVGGLLKSGTTRARALHDDLRYAPQLFLADACYGSSIEFTTTPNTIAFLFAYYVMLIM